MAFDHIGIAFLDDARQALDRGVLGFLGVRRIDHDQFFPAAVIGQRDARDVIVCDASARSPSPDEREHFELQAAQLFERQSL